MTIDEKTQKKVIGLISLLLPEARIYLFGSRARGTASEWSDIDLALDAGHQLPILSVGEVNNVMEALSTPFKIDVVDLHHVSPEMFHEIMRDKVVWKA